MFMIVELFFKKLQYFEFEQKKQIDFFFFVQKKCCFFFFEQKKYCFFFKKNKNCFKPAEILLNAFGF